MQLISANSSAHKTKRYRNSVCSQNEGAFSLPKLKLNDVFQQFHLRYSQKTQEKCQTTKKKSIRSKSKMKNKENKQHQSLINRLPINLPKQTISQYVRARIDNERKRFQIYQIVQDKMKRQRAANLGYRRRVKMTQLSQSQSQYLSKQKSRRSGFGILSRQEKYNSKFDFLYDNQN